MSLAHQSQTGTGRPPLKGSFPLDRRRECAREEAQYLQCLGSSGSSTSKSEPGGVSTRSFDHLHCRGLAEEFLRCRMDANLMSKEDLSKLGFRSPSAEEGSSVGDASSHAVGAEEKEEQRDVRRKEEEGFLAGLQAIQPYTSRGFFGRLSSRYSWAQSFFDLPFLRKSGPSNHSPQQETRSE